MIKILIADDHAIVRRGVRDILEEMPEEVEIVEVSTAKDALKETINTKFDIAIMDISFPDGNGLDVFNQIFEIQPSTRVLFLSMFPEEQYARRALSSGAYGYLTKDSAPTELLTAIYKVIAGSKYVSTSMAERLVQQLVDASATDAHELLSNREFQVMLFTARGKKINEIASDLCLSPKTVSTYRARILSKLNLNTTYELIRYVMDHNLDKM